MDQPALHSETEHRRALRRALPADLAPHLAEPLLAGMRARAVAEACERAGLAAVMIDAGGRVLHLSTRARAMLGTTMALVAGHLIGRSRADKRVLERAIGAALSQVEGADQDLTLQGRSICTLPYVDPSPYQLLRGLLIFAEATGSLDETGLRSALFA